MDDNPTPLIALTCGLDPTLPHRRDLYEMAVRRAGGEAFFLPPGSIVDEVVLRYDGFIIPGGGDVEPSVYGESLLCEVSPEGAERVDFEFSLLREIIRLQKPVLGICYGMQLINVYFQGSLYQDIRLQVPDSLDHSSGGHGISIEDNPFWDSGAVGVNSSHHQAVKLLGKGLKPFAYADDGIIEALYNEGGGFMVGVQWHPERTQSVLTTKLFMKFIEACLAKR